MVDAVAVVAAVAVVVNGVVGAAVIDVVALDVA